MAMIQCPNCSGSISDKAKKCIHCGYELIPEGKKKCVECGAELEDTATVCPKCGCPIPDEKSVEATVQNQAKVTGVKMTHKSKKMIGIIAAAIVILIVAVFGIRNIHNEKVSKEYGENLELATITMLSGAADSEGCGNLIKSVWYNAIYEERDTETDPYTRPHGYFVSDFNVALSNLFSDSSFTSKIDQIKSNQNEVQSLMKELSNPPEEYEEAYSAISKLYEAYTSLTNLVIDPTGSLTTFSENFNNADTETSNCYSAMKLYLN